MKVKQYVIRSIDDVQDNTGEKTDLVLGFGLKHLVGNTAIYNKLRQAYPNATLALSSSAGEISGLEVYNDTISLTAITFEKTSIQSHGINISDFENSYDAGANLIGKLPKEGLKYIMVISDGGLVNGSELVKGMHSIVGQEIPITGGLAGDGADFNFTLVGLNELPIQGRILAIGFYGENLKIAHGSFGGWEPFGLEKTVTKSASNVLYEINGNNALETYKEYLGKYASELPGSALLFPLSIKLKGSDQYLVRTILSIDNEKSSMIFAGDIPEGSTVRFMKANIDRLVDAASTAANDALTSFDQIKPDLAILISCVGRKLVLGERVDEEVEAVSDVLGSSVQMAGYYSYGEISPIMKGGSCELHNQTMTITCIQE